MFTVDTYRDTEAMTALSRVSHRDWNQAHHFFASHPGFATLDQAEATVRASFPGWFVYRGGNHVALHRTNATARVLFFRLNQGR